jgi:hypothetical protein
MLADAIPEPIDDDYALVSVRWTSEELHREKARLLAADLAVLGKQPRWWRFRARRRYDRLVRQLKKSRMSELQLILAVQDPRHRTEMVSRVGWLLWKKDR